MHVCTDYASVYTLIRKSFGGVSLEFNIIQLTAENREEWRKLVVKSQEPDYGISEGEGEGAWTDLPHITQLCGLCCLEETAARLVHFDRFLPVTALTIQFLLLPGKKK